MVWVPTYCGVKFDLLEPKPVDVRPHDISYSLSNTARFTGHTPYSVAEHSLMVADLVPPELELFGLLHDAAEAYTGDISRPLKILLGETFREIEERIEAAIAIRFGLEWTPEIKRLVKQADDIALSTEFRDLFLIPLSEWDRGELMPPAERTIRPGPPVRVRAEFENRLAPLVKSTRRFPGRR